MAYKTTTSFYLELGLKFVAVICGVTLVLASAHKSLTGIDIETLQNYMLEQLGSPAQLKLIIGLIFITGGLFFQGSKKYLARSFLGVRDINSDAYQLYLIEKYQIQKNEVIEKIVCQEKLFDSALAALVFADSIENLADGVPVKPRLRRSAVTLTASPAVSLESSPSTAANFSKEHSDSTASNFSGIRDIFSNRSNITMARNDVKGNPRRLIKVLLLIGILLYAIVLSGFYFMNFKAKQAPAITPVAALSANDSANQNFDQSISSTLSPTAKDELPDPAIASKVIAVPINDRWLGVWKAENGKQKLSITATSLTYGDDEFTWVGIRPKGVIKCCPAFYEGTTTKVDLLTRLGENPEAQKDYALVNGLGEGNFKKIVLADPFLRKYFFIYDQNFVYLIGRDMGDKAALQIEQFKKVE